MGFLGNVVMAIDNCIGKILHDHLFQGLFHHLKPFLGGGHFQWLVMTITPCLEGKVATWEEFKGPCSLSVFFSV